MSSATTMSTGTTKSSVLDGDDNNRSEPVAEARMVTTTMGARYGSSFLISLR